MRFFENKKIFQKMIIAILIVTLSMFVFSSKVKAKADEGNSRKIIETGCSFINGIR